VLTNNDRLKRKGKLDQVVGKVKHTQDVTSSTECKESQPMRSLQAVKVVHPVVGGAVKRPLEIAQLGAANPEQSVRQAIDAARATYEGLESRALELQRTIRGEERLVAQWRRQIREAQEQIERWQEMLAPAEVRLGRARDDFSLLADSPSSAWSHSVTCRTYVSPEMNGVS
jgi:hypothetical protein